MATGLVNLTPIAIAIIGVVIIAISSYLIPYIKTKMSAEQLRNLYTWTEVGVKAAEQLCKSGVIRKEERKKYVLDFLANKGLTINLDEVEALIESFVKDLPPLIISGVTEKTEKDE